MFRDWTPNTLQAFRDAERQNIIKGRKVRRRKRRQPKTYGKNKRQR